MQRNIYISLLSLILVFSFFNIKKVHADQSTQIYGEFTNNDFTIKNCENFLPTLATSTKFRLTLPQYENFTPATFPSWSEVETLNYGGQTSATEPSTMCATIASYGQDNFDVAFGSSGDTGIFYIWWYNTFNQKVGYTRVDYIKNGTSTTPRGENSLNISRIENTVPEFGTSTPVATSTQFLIGADVYVSSTDFDDDTTEVYIRWRQQSGQGQRNNPITGEVGECTIPILASSTIITVSCETPILNTGVYTAYIEIRKRAFEIFGYDFLPTANTIVSKIGNFVVGEAEEYEWTAGQISITTTGIGSGVDRVIDETNEATSTGFFLSYLNYPALLKTKAPFSFVYETASIINTSLSTYGTSTSELSDSKRATTTPTLVLNFVNPNATNTPSSIKNALNNLTVFSATTVSTFLPAWVLALIRTISIAVIWTGVAMLMYNRLKEKLFQSRT